MGGDTSGSRRNKIHSISLDATEVPEAPLSRCVSFGETPEWPESKTVSFPQRLPTEPGDLNLNYNCAWAPRLASEVPSGSSDVCAFFQLGCSAGKLHCWQWAQCRLQQSWQGQGNVLSTPRAQSHLKETMAVCRHSWQEGKRDLAWTSFSATLVKFMELAVSASISSTSGLKMKMAFQTMPKR